MIIAKRKPLEEILSMIEPYKKVLVAGCNGCVAICLAGGEKEVGILASALRLARRQKKQELLTVELTIERQCEHEFIDALTKPVSECEAVISMACGIGVQALAERFRDRWVFPGVNTEFLGMPVEQGVWNEYCAACGNCLLGITGGICPVARCSKSLLNGPCGGTEKGKCEVDREHIECAWHLIYERLKEKGRLDILDELQKPRDWSTSRDGGVRRIVREDMRL
ncbi:MAG: methylenetetrahydrofolate reductase C-terminal domain-containing protein [Candidatus Eremiobacteraeota bacterium]|nr:methylenetetrahydrofolate reductase C-terminal domain-containing protein [Candidatus Eremiobacteraeota bacterium]